MFCVSCKLLQALASSCRMSEGFPGRAGAWPVSAGASNNNSGLGGWSVTPSPAGADNKDSLGRPGQTRPDKHDKTGRGCKPLGKAIGAGPLALPARDPLAQARNRGHGSALQRRLRLFPVVSLLLCHTLPSIRPSIPSISIQPAHPVRLGTLVSAKPWKVPSVAPVTIRPGSAGVTGNRRKHYPTTTTCLYPSVRTWQQQRVRSEYHTVFASCIMLHSRA